MEQAQAELDKYSQTPTELSIKTPLPKPASSLGKKSVIYMQNPTPTAKEQSDAIKAAAEVLGWDFKAVPFQQTPADTQAAFESAIAMKPDVIMDSATSADLIKTQLAEMADQGIKWVTCCNVLPEGMANPPIANMSGGRTLALGGDLMADWMATKTNGKANALIVGFSLAPVLTPVVEHTQARLKELCPDTCKSTVLDAQPTDIGSKLPGAIVSALQADPSINYVALSFGALGIGLPQALKQAGLDSSVKIIGGNPNATNFEDINNGTEEMAIAQNANVASWSMVNAYLSYLAGMQFPIEALDWSNDGPTALQVPQVVSQATGTLPPTYDAPANYQDLFKALWGM